MRALIGYTGFVGGSLLRQDKFEATFNSKNSQDMRGRHFSEIICAGISATKWKANKEPETDRQAIAALEDVLREVTADRFILISTIDVYPSVQGGNEHTDVHKGGNHAYGKHRLAFEDFCRAQFAHCFVVRLPGLFGVGLRKNIIYDLLHDNGLETINPRSSFQYYDLEHLTGDIGIMIENKIRLLNLFTEPVSTQTILDRFFSGKKVGEKAGPEAHYNIGTAYAHLWNEKSPYRMSQASVLKHMGDFIHKEKSLREAS